jgi:hypothetical protein
MGAKDDEHLHRAPLEGSGVSQHFAACRRSNGCLTASGL